jgi:flagellar motor switch protein FliN/FliY
MEAGKELIERLAEEWAALLAQILESMTDQKPQIASKLVAVCDAGENPFWWEQRLSLSASPLVFVGAPARTWNELGGRTLRAAGIDTVEEADARNTYLEILNQSLSGLAQSLSGRIGHEVSCAQGDECAAAPAKAEWALVEVTYPDAELPGIFLGFSPSLIAQLENPEQQPAEGQADPSDSARKPDELPVDALAAFVPHKSKTLELLLDVELPVSVSFGRAELPLKDVLKLTTGSIVELNRGVNEPVEVIVNNCVVARGEVVVMDGNYGVRIHQIISPQERLRTLK